MRKKEKIYNGTVSLKQATDSVVMLGSPGKPSRITIKEETYSNLCKWMRNYSDRFTFIEGRRIKLKGTPIFPTADELKREFGMTRGQMNIVAKQNGDALVAFSYDDVNEEQKTTLEKLGLTTGVVYVALKTQYPFLKDV